MTQLLHQLKAAIRQDKHEARDRAHVAICESKQRFNTKRGAWNCINARVAHGGDPRVRPYKCHVCGKYHLTTKKKR